MQPEGTEQHVSFQELRLQVRALSLYRGVLEDDIGRQFCGVLDFLGRGGRAPQPGFEAAVEGFGRLSALLLAEALSGPRLSYGDAWQAHLIERILNDANPFSLAAQRRDREEPPPALLAQARAELGVLRGLYGLTLDVLRRALLATCPERNGLLQALWPDRESRGLPPRRDSAAAAAGGGIRELLQEIGDWGSLTAALAGHYARAGTGLLGRYRAFRWVARDGAGALEGIPDPDPVRLEDLVGYQREREVVLRNTRYFVHGAPGNNVLLYGDSGTGKSSLVKALLNAFGDEGLRLVEVPKEHLADFPYIARQLRGRRERFILFVDDFSFEEHETEYKALKALLEGSLEARPENVLVYATSNRRHLVREQFADRPAAATEDLHPFETVQEKLSLAERFGIRVAFLSPDQEGYLGIVQALARQQGIALAPEALRHRALQWAQWQHGFSGRTARQFIDDLVGELAEEGGRPGDRGQGV